MLLVHLAEELAGVAELVGIGAVEADDDPVQVADLGQLLADARHRLGFQLGIETRQDEGDLALLGKDLELVLHLFRGAGAQVVQGCDVSVLVEIGQGVSFL